MRSKLFMVIWNIGDTLARWQRLRYYIRRTTLITRYYHLDGLETGDLRNYVNWLKNTPGVKSVEVCPEFNIAKSIIKCAWWCQQKRILESVSPDQLKKAWL